MCIRKVCLTIQAFVSPRWLEQFAAPSQQAGWLVGWLAGWLGRWLEKLLAPSWLADRLNGWLGASLAGRLNGGSDLLLQASWLDGWLAEWLEELVCSLAQWPEQANCEPAPAELASAALQPHAHHSKLEKLETKLESAQ